MSVSQTWNVHAPISSDRFLYQGPTVPEGETWKLTFALVKWNGDLVPGSAFMPRVSNLWAKLRALAKRFRLGVRVPEINAAVWDNDRGQWICLAAAESVPEFGSASWSGEITMGPGWRLGLWVRGGPTGTVAQGNAAWEVKEA